MLRDFLASHRDGILARSRSMLGARHVPTATESELTNDLPIFFDQLAVIIQLAKGDRTADHQRIGTSRGPRRARPTARRARRPMGCVR